MERLRRYVSNVPSEVAGCCRLKTLALRAEPLFPSDQASRSPHGVAVRTRTARLSGRFCVERFHSKWVFPINSWRNKMSNLDNQPRRGNQAGFDTPDNRTGLDNRSTGLGTGTITAIIAAAVIAGALMLFGPWGSNRTAISNSTPTTNNSTPGTTTGQTSSSSPRVITPPAAPTTTAPAPTAR